MPPFASASGGTCPSSGKGEAEKGVRASERAGVQGGGFHTLDSYRHRRSPGLGGRRARGEKFPAVSQTPPLSRLGGRACRLPMVSLLLTEVRGTRKLSSPALPNWGLQVERNRTGVGRSESNEDDPAPIALQVIPPSD